MQLLERYTACSDCGEEFPLEKGENQNDEEKKILSDAVRDSVQGMLVHLVNQGHTLASMERALDLPNRTLSKWRTEGTSMAGVTLVRLLRTFPWLLNVAAHDYSQSVAFTEIEKAFMEILAQLHAQRHSQVFLGHGTASVGSNTISGYIVVGTNNTDGTHMPATILSGSSECEGVNIEASTEATIKGGV